MLAVPCEIGRQRVGVDRGGLKESAELLGLIKGGFGKLAEFGDKIVNRNLLCRGGHGLLPEKYTAAGGSFVG